MSGIVTGRCVPLGISCTERQTRNLAADISIIIPCLNEADSLRHALHSANAALQGIAGLNLAGEIVVVDNGSTDNSAQIAQEQGCRIIHCPTRGYGNALMAGINQTSSPFLIMGDADGSYDFTEAVPMIRQLQVGYDLCMGTRLKGKILPGAMPWKNRYIGNPLLTRLLNLFFHSGLSDAYCGLRAFTREAYLKMKLTSPGMELASEMVVKASFLKLKRTEVPVTLHPDRRNHGPHLKPWRDGWTGLKLLLLYSPKWLFFIPAMVMMGLAGMMMTALLLTPEPQSFFLGPLRLGDHWMIFAGGLFIIGYQVFSFGVISTIYHYNRNGPAIQPWFSAKLMQFMSLENLVIMSAILVFAGVLILSYVSGKWIMASFGPLFKLRYMMAGTILIVLGIQTFFSGFIFALLLEEER